MTQFKSNFLQTLQARGFIHQITHPDELDAAAAAGIVTGYIGFDATAPSLHVGSLIQIMMLRRLQQAGGKPIVVMGGGTTKVGDPSGKDESRQLLDDSVHFTISRMLSFDSVKLRLDREQPLTFIEFNYMLMQAVDFLELERRYGCTLQMGGSDQWGNILNGVELIRRVDGKPSFG